MMPDPKEVRTSHVQQKLSSAQQIYIPTDGNPGIVLQDSSLFRPNPATQHVPTAKPTNSIITPEITVEDALEAVPTFDGRATAFRAFAEGCRSAKDMVNPQMETNLVKIIKNRLRGLAREAIERTTFEDIEMLICFLENLFSPPQSLSSLQGKLSTSLQLSTENVVMYGTRVKRLTNLIIETYNKSGDGHPRYREEAEKEAVKIFVRGLRKGLHVNANKYQDLNSAIRAAIEVESDKQTYEKLHRIFQNITKWSRFQRNELDDDRPSKSNNFHSEVPVCTHCRKPGHTIDRCWFKHRSPLNLNNSSVRECRYCKKKGHTINECRKRKYAEEQRKNQGNGQTFPTSGAVREETWNGPRVAKVTLTNKNGNEVSTL